MTLAVSAPNLVSVNPALPARNLKELVALIKSSPGKYSYTSGGVGTQGHLLGEMLRLSQALDIVHVPFNGAAPAIAATVAGHTPITWGTIASAAQALEAGQLRPLAVASKTRSQLLADVPTTAEAGYPQIEGDSWIGLLAPAGTPTEIIAAVQREIARILAMPDVKQRLPVLGLEAVASTPEEFATRIRSNRDPGQGRPRRQHQSRNDQRDIEGAGRGTGTGITLEPQTLAQAARGSKSSSLICVTGSGKKPPTMS